MKRKNEIIVGLVVVVAFVSVIGGALWLSGARIGRTEALHTARFRTVGGLGVGNPVVLRGVRVGRVEAIRLASGNWVEADLRIYAGVALPQRPAVVATSVSLFGEWAANLTSVDQPPDDPNVRKALAEAMAAGGRDWPGATLPDVGQLTAQAGRIANDIAAVAARVQTAFDSEAVSELRRSIKDFGTIADRLARAANEQADNIGTVGNNLSRGSTALARAANVLESTLGRVDTATQQGQLATILNNASAASQDVRAASQNLRELMDATHRSQESFVHVVAATDTVLSRIVNRDGTVGLLVADSALYRETTLAMIQLRQLLSDVQANPRRYFTFSVF